MSRPPATGKATALLVTLMSLIVVTSPDGHGDFRHPGLQHSRADLHRMKQAVAAKEAPAWSAFEAFRRMPHSQHDYQRRGPFAEVGRAPTIHMGECGSDATAAYHNALMWVITEDHRHADKAIELINVWMETLKRVTGRDGILGAGLQGIKFANAAEILRHSNSGWPEDDSIRCEQWFRNVWHPKIAKYAIFANSNWEGAALQMKMAIAVYCSDRKLFEEAVRYCVNGSGNGSITHTIVFPTGQAQETTRAQHYAQLGMGLLCNTAEIAWNQGVDLYSWADNRIMAGFEYHARYGLGKDVPYEHYLDRTGKYGFGGRYNPYDKISTKSRGSFQPIFEQPWNHYAHRRGLQMPWVEQVIDRQRPEGRSSDHTGLGTLSHTRPLVTNQLPATTPGIPSGLMARSPSDGSVVQLTWAASVEPDSCTNADSYRIERSSDNGNTWQTADEACSKPEFTDTEVKKGQPYEYRIFAANRSGISEPSAPLTTVAGLPADWRYAEVGNTHVTGSTEFNGVRFRLEGEGTDIGENADNFHFAFRRLTGNGSLTARLTWPMSSQWTKPGVMMRESLNADARHASVLLLPHWNGSVVSRTQPGGATSQTNASPLPEGWVKYDHRILKPWWMRIRRKGNTFTGSMSPDGISWTPTGDVEIKMPNEIYVGLPACSQLPNVTTVVTYDHVDVQQAE